MIAGIGEQRRGIHLVRGTRKLLDAADGTSQDGSDYRRDPVQLNFEGLDPHDLVDLADLAGRLGINGLGGVNYLKERLSAPGRGRSLGLPRAADKFRRGVGGLHADYRGKFGNRAVGDSAAVFRIFQRNRGNAIFDIHFKRVCYCSSPQFAGLCSR